MSSRVVGLLVDSKDLDADTEYEGCEIEVSASRHLPDGVTFIQCIVAPMSPYQGASYTLTTDNPHAFHTNCRIHSSIKVVHVVGLASTVVRGPSKASCALAVCKRCGAGNEWAVPNRPDGTYICYECR
jgi:hypothetical protein